MPSAMESGGEVCGEAGLVMDSHRPGRRCRLFCNLLIHSMQSLSAIYRFTLITVGYYVIYRFTVISVGYYVIYRFTFKSLSANM